MRTTSLILLVLAVSAAPYGLAETPAKPGLSDNLTDAGKVGLHLVRSHGLEAVHRPVSLVSRLGLLATYAVRDTSREVALRMVVKPALDDTPIPPLHRGAGMDLDAWESELDGIVGRRSRSSGRASMLVGGEAYFASLVSEIASARESIKVRTYIFDRDDYSLAMAGFLKTRSFEVETKVMFDGLGTILAERVAAESQPEMEREPLGITTYLLDGSAIKVRNLTNPWFTGDHVKTTIIDERVGFLGGMNIGREYRFDWHDLMVRLEGPVVADLSRNFDRKWSHSGSFGDLRVLGQWLKPRRSRKHDDGYPMRVITTKPAASHLYRAQRAAIHNAKGYIYIENPYLSDETLLNDLVRARLRGVDVRVILALGGNHGVMNRSNVVAANTLLKFGVRVFAYPGMTHVKAAVYDGWATVGSANFDHLSMRVNTELNVASSAPEFVSQLVDDVFTPDFAASKELTAPLDQNWRHRLSNIVASQL